MEPNKNTSVFLRDTCKLGQVVKIQGGYSFQSSAFTNRGIPIIRISNIDNDLINLKNSVVFYEELRNLDENFIAKDGDLLIAMSGATTGKAGVYKNTNLAYINQRVGKFVVTKSDKVIYKYLSYWVSSNHFTKQLSKYLASGAQPNISPKNIEDMDIVLPDTKTQEKIIRTLDAISNNISNLEALVSKQESIKKTTEFLLLQPKDNWNKVKLGEVVEYYKGNGLSKEKLSSKGTYPCILYGELFTRYTEIINSVYSKTVFMEGVASCDGDVLMPGSTTTCGEDLAKASAITQDNVLLGGDVIILRPNKKRLDGRFLAYLISQYKKELIKYTQGITIIHLQGNKMLDMVISIPDLETQRSTINHIVAIDKELEHLRSELDKYRNIKKGLMDYFFG